MFSVGSTLAAPAAHKLEPGKPTKQQKRTGRQRHIGWVATRARRYAQLVRRDPCIAEQVKPRGNSAIRCQVCQICSIQYEADKHTSSVAQVGIEARASDVRGRRVPVALITYRQQCAFGFVAVMVPGAIVVDWPGNCDCSRAGPVIQNATTVGLSFIRGARERCHAMLCGVRKTPITVVGQGNPHPCVNDRVGPIPK